MLSFGGNDTTLLKSSYSLKRKRVDVAAGDDITEEGDGEVARTMALDTEASTAIQVIRVKNHSYTTYRAYLEHLYTGQPIFYSTFASLTENWRLGLDKERPSAKDMYALAQSAFFISCF